MTGNIINVASATQLRGVLRVVKGGETIRLAPGDYGSVFITQVNPASTVTIVSADPNNDASLRSLSITRSSNLVISDLDIKRPLLPGESIGSAAVMVNTARDVSLVGLNLTGSLDNNASNDGLGVVITGSERVSLLDSTLQQFRTATVVSLNRDIIVAGNTIREVREGVNVSGLQEGLFERNVITDMQANYAAGDHPDAFQVHTSRGGGSSDLVFRDNVIIEGKSMAVGGILIGNERMAEGVRHDDIVIENNFYQGTYRHAITVTGATDVLIDNNTVLDSARSGVQAGINLHTVDRAKVTDNLAPIFTTTASTNVQTSNNIDVWDARSRVGVAANTLFAADIAGGNANPWGNLDPLAGGQAAARGIGYRGDLPVGDLGSDAQGLALASDYARMFGQDLMHAYLL